MVGEQLNTPASTHFGPRKVDGITAHVTKSLGRTESHRPIRQLSTNRLDQIGAPTPLLK